MEQEVTDTLDDDVDESRIQRMIETERELLEQRRESEASETTGEVEQTTDEDDEGDTPAVTATIRTVEKDEGPYGRPELRVKLFADGEVWEDTLNWPDDPSDPDAAVNRLCELCDVEPGRVADLQGESVPVTYDDLHEEYNLVLPSTTTRPARELFRVWWWMRRRGTDPQKVVKGAKASIPVGIYALGVRAVWVMFTENLDNVSLSEYTATVLTLGPNAFTSLPGKLLSGLFGLVLLLLAVAVPMLTLLVGGMMAHVLAKNGLQWLDSNVNPF